MRITSLLVFLVFNLSLYARVDTLWVHSNAMNKEIGSTVILPDNYDSSDWSYRVVYILHGAGGDYGNWLRRFPKLKDLANKHGFILVCPDGEKTSWYLDSPIDSSMQYETYIIDELVPEVDSRYRTQKSNLRRAITGLSMGGHGALFLSMRNPEVFSVVGSMSGGVDLRPFPENWDLPLRLGTIKERPQNWEQHSVVAIAEKAEQLPYHIIFDCGTEDFFIEVNRNLESVLKSRGASYEYSERKGAHNWPYWRESIVYHLEFFEEVFNLYND